MKPSILINLGADMKRENENLFEVVSDWLEHVAGERFATKFFRFCGVTLSSSLAPGYDPQLDSWPDFIWGFEEAWMHSPTFNRADEATYYGIRKLQERFGTVGTLRMFTQFYDAEKALREEKERAQELAMSGTSESPETTNK